MYAQPFINWTQTEVDDPDSLRFQLDPNNHKVNPEPYLLLRTDTQNKGLTVTPTASASSWTQMTCDLLPQGRRQTLLYEHTFNQGRPGNGIHVWIVFSSCRHTFVDEMTHAATPVLMVLLKAVCWLCDSAVHGRVW